MTERGGGTDQSGAQGEHRGDEAQENEPRVSSRGDARERTEGEPRSDAREEAEGEARSEVRGEPEAEPRGEVQAEPRGEAPGRTRPARRGVRGRIATAVSVFGELMITAGLILGLFVAYSLWWTNVLADQEAKRESSKVRENWAERDDVPGDLETEDGIGFLHVPAMSGSEVLVKPGTDPKELNQGIAGYYEKPRKSAMPWDQQGNFSMAAHRDGHGAKFHNIHKIKEGDPVVFETKNTWFIYKVYAILPQTSKYNVDVLAPIPKESGKKTAGRYITLTTCTPIFTSNYRYIVWGELERTEAVDADRTPPKELARG